MVRVKPFESLEERRQRWPSGWIPRMASRGLAIANESDPGIGDEFPKATIGHQEPMVSHSSRQSVAIARNSGVSIAGRSVNSVTPARAS